MQMFALKLVGEDLIEFLDVKLSDQLAILSLNIKIIDRFQNQNQTFPDFKKSSRVVLQNVRFYNYQSLF